VDQAFSIAHLPMPPRNWTGAESAYRLETAFPNFFLDTLVDQPIETAQQDPIKRLGLMAGRLDELAAMDHDLMVERYLDHHLDSLARAYCQLKTLQARTAEAPEPWRDYLDQAVARLNQALVADHAQVSLSGYPSDLRDERLSAWWRDQWDRFAHALRAWPAIRQVARHCTAGVPRVE
jgi:hypothetical protein